MIPTALIAAALPLLRRLDPETAHGMALSVLRRGLVSSDRTPDDPILGIDVLGRRFGNPIGLAAGFDKNAVAFPALLDLGFGFVEVGTVTPRPQVGNPKPRLFRLPADRAVINRMGMNGGGLEEFLRHLAAGATRRQAGSVLGVNVGINKDGADPERDYPALVGAAAPFADYITVNVSSPNTPGLRDLQGEARLRGILAAIRCALPSHPPLLVKIAPDLSDDGLHAVIDTCVAAGIAGLVVSNTTIDRPASLRGPFRAEAGGLSGRPLFARSTAVLALAHRLAAGRLVLIGCGGISTGRDALAKIRAGAQLLQIYTAFAYEGPALIPRLKSELAAALRADGFALLSDAVGVDAARSSLPAAEPACSI